MPPYTKLQILLVVATTQIALSSYSG